ncbi:MAG: glutamate-5-semialdehyde dehydrogenase [Muribaculaceae bacterium]|nr:glutamate-5-semialdehyde dehydrogenase [Muribaculaceae bacterium]
MISNHYNFRELVAKVRETTGKLASLSDDQRNKVIIRLAELLSQNHSDIFKANKLDLEKMDETNPLYDRLRLTDSRLDAIQDSLRYIASLPSPVGEIIEKRRLPNGIELEKRRVPFGVIGIIYEARPNVTVDVFALCFKSGNASILKGGSDAANSNEAIMKIIRKALEESGLSEFSCILLPSSHQATENLLNAVGLVDLCIPRGGKSLINFVRDNARIPVIETGAGVVHTFFDREGNPEIARKVIENGKTRRVSVCNALDSLLVDKARLMDLPILIHPLAEKHVELYADPDAFLVLKGNYPDSLLFKASQDDYSREWMDYKMGVFTVNNVEEAIKQINRHGSGHSESIITENRATAEKFCNEVDAACVYVNLPTSFTDGGEFGLGAEIGISTQKLGPRGPMGLSEITTYKYILSGNGQTRP